jgi:hypothetical protein
MKNIFTYKDLLEALQKLTPEQLDCNLNYYDNDIEEFIEFQYELKTDQDSPYFEIEF